MLQGTLISSVAADSIRADWLQRVVDWTLDGARPIQEFPIWAQIGEVRQATVEWLSDWDTSATTTSHVSLVVVALVLLQLVTADELPVITVLVHVALS